MQNVRQQLGGLGNLMFKEAYLASKVFSGELPDIYVQDYRLWNGWDEQIIQLFSKGIGPRVDYVSVHIRRGDYLKAQYFHTNLSETDYYSKALALFPNDEFLVFCRDTQNPEQDLKDREWCRQFLESVVPGRWKFSPLTNSEVEDLNEMASCKSNIIANSTFSFWAGFLNPNPNKKVVAPKQWFVNQPSIPLLDSWLTI